jgi:hypothetical protein
MNTFSSQSADLNNAPPNSASSSSQKTISGTFDSDSSTNGKTLNASRSRQQSNPLYDEYVKGMQEWEQMKSGGNAQEMLAEVERQTRIGASIARTLSYAHQYRAAREDRPQHDEPSITIPQPNMTFGERS